MQNSYIQIRREQTDVIKPKYLCKPHSGLEYLTAIKLILETLQNKQLSTKPESTCRNTWGANTIDTFRKSV